MKTAEYQAQIEKHVEYIAERFERMFAPGEVHELRIPKVDGKKTRIDSGFFDDYQKMAEAAARYSGRASGVYVTMNPINRDLLARGHNKVNEWVGTGETAADNTVTRIKWLLIDPDPVRLPGISSTDEEHEQALTRAQAIKDWLTARGWPMPMKGDSGNGAHVDYRTDLEATDKNKKLIEKVVKSIAFWFDDEIVTIDQTVTNPARIWKVYGTKACKGDDVKGFRPHRFAKIELDDIPDFDQIVTREQLQEVADLLPEDTNDDEKKSQKSYTGGDAFQWLDNWMKQNNLDVSQERSFDGTGRKWSFNVCPHNPDHTDGAALLQFASGKIGFKCHHNGCKGKGWQELRTLYDGPKETRYKTSSNGTGPGRYDGQDTDGVKGAMSSGSTVDSDTGEIASFTPSELLMAELTAFGYTFAQNDLDNGIYVNGELIEDGLEADIKTKIRDLYSSLAQNDDTRPKWRVSWLVDTYTGAAYRNKFHPVKDYLNSLEWDQERFYISELIQHFTDLDPVIVYPGEGDRPKRTRGTLAVYMRKWLIGTVAKALNPSSQTQVPMLVIVGKQGDGKSTFAQWLGSPLPELTIESPIQPDNPEHARYLSTKWIWEAAELGATTRRADVEALKAFITKVDSTFRKPYDRYPMVKPALSSFIGTVNDGIGFLNDISGNRRFHVVRVGNIDWEYINAVDINQVWAEAVHAYRAGESWQLDKHERAHRDSLNSQHETEDAFEGWILKYYEIDETQEDWLTQSSEIVSTIQSMGVTGGTKAIQNGVSTYLKRRGLTQHWTRPRKWIGIKPQDWLIKLREAAKTDD